MINQFYRRIYTGYFLLAVLEGSAALWALLKIPADPQNTLFLGYSGSRLLLMTVIIVVILGFVWAVSQSWLGTRFFGRMVDAVNSGIQQQGSRIFLYFWLLLLVFIGGMFLKYWTGVQAFPTYQALITRLLPIITFLSTICLQSAVLLIIFRLRLADDREKAPADRRILIFSGLILLQFLILWGLAAFQGIGTRPDSEWWHPNSPILLSQIAAALLIVLIVQQITRWLGRFINPERSAWLDMGIAVVLWLGAFFIWQAVPLFPSFFNPQPVAPNFEYYPNTDAKDYDLVAQFLLIGQGFGGGRLVLRPLFSFLLALYHLIGGQSYTGTVSVQIALLAFYPVVMYFLGRELHSRFAGVLAGLFVILKEYNAIVLGGAIPGAHSHLKLLMTDVPTAFFIALFTLIFLLWLRAPERRRWLPLIAGGSLGALVLIRSQALVLLPVAAAVALILFWRHPRLWVRAAVMLALGVGLFIAPWYVRNYQLSGMWVMEIAPSFPLGFEARYYTGKSVAETSPLPGEKGTDYNARMTAMVTNFMLKHPDVVLNFTADHFMHNEINSVYQLPFSADAFNVKNYVLEKQFWHNTGTPLSTGDQVAVFINLAILALGIGASFGLGRVWMLLPLLVHAGYNLSTALARRSGARYFIPGDWVTLLIYAIGLAQIVLWLAVWTGYLTADDRFLKERRSAELITPYARREFGAVWKRWLRPGLGIALVILLCGSILPVSELLFPRRYAPLSDIQLMEKARAILLKNGVAEDEMNTFFASEGAVVQWGRALYPRFYKAGEGIRSSEPAKDRDRFIFHLIGDQKDLVYYFNPGAPERFLNASDVIVVGCQGDAFVDAFHVIVLDSANDDEGFVLSRSLNRQFVGCPLP